MDWKELSSLIPGVHLSSVGDKGAETTINVTLFTCLLTIGVLFELWTIHDRLKLLKTLEDLSDGGLVFGPGGYCFIFHTFSI